MEFLQLSPNATTLNRILDHNGSEVHRQIDGSGHVILMNSHGVMFGKNVAEFPAATAERQMQASGELPGAVKTGSTEVSNPVASS